MNGLADIQAAGPRVSVIIPAYNSHATLAACLQALDCQTVGGFQTILIDSSPDDACESIVRSAFPGIEYEHVAGRMLPHEARNYGAQRAGGSLLVFTDPDIYPHPDWLENMLALYDQQGGVVIGSVECHGAAWLDTGVHLAKFDLFLPGGPIRQLDVAPTLSMLCPRAVFDDLGGFAGEHMIGDTLFSWELAERGVPITFAPEAIVAHHHTMGWGRLLHERYSRGREFSRLRAQRFCWSRVRVARQLLVTLLPLRWLNLMRRTMAASLVAGMAGRMALTLPLVMSGHAAWLLGELRGLVDAL